MFSDECTNLFVCRGGKIGIDVRGRGEGGRADCTQLLQGLSWLVRSNNRKR